MDNGDLIEYGGRWWVYEPDFSPEFANATLLAAADADLWEALRGLPGMMHIGESNGDTFIYLHCGESEDDQFDIDIRRYINGEIDVTVDVQARDSAILDKASNYMKALRQYIAAKAVQDEVS